ncbi:MAG TPA: class I SAM-dependent methyltransferase [Terriglobia bacterium]|nr:class I SAM-dependent methyltransferase [Terriglobia bacterium]
MIRLIKQTVKRIPQIHRLIQERDELKDHLCRLNCEMDGLTRDLRQITRERDEFLEHLNRLNRENAQQSIHLHRITLERDELSAHLDRVSRERDRMDLEMRRGFGHFPPGHFYSPIPHLEEVRKDEKRIFHDPRTIPGVDLNLDAQFELIDQLKDYYPEMPFPSEKEEGRRFFHNNPAFGGADAVYLYGMIRHLEPRRIIEVGSGYSSCVMLDTNDLFFDGLIACTFIEPNPQLLLSLLTNEDQHKIDFIPKRVQDVSLDKFSALQARDILFIDSSHVSKVGSDVNFIFFHILPALQSGVYIHFHDILFPFEYPTEWVYEGRAWNEVYLLRAFLQYNPAFKIVLFNAVVANLFSDKLRQEMPRCLQRTGGIWIVKC